MFWKVYGWMGLGIEAHEGVGRAKNGDNINGGRILTRAPKIGEIRMKNNVPYPQYGLVHHRIGE